MIKPLIFLDPFPRNEAMVYTQDCAAALAEMGNVVAHWGSRAPDALVEEHLFDMTILIGQTAMPKERLDRARERGLLDPSHAADADRHHQREEPLQPPEGEAVRADGALPRQRVPLQP